MERGQHSDRQDRGQDSSDEDGEPGAPASGLRDDGTVRMFDPEHLNVTWSGVGPDVCHDEYIEGNMVAQQAGAAAHAVYALLKNRGPLDRLQMMTDINGRPHVDLTLSAELVFEVVALIRAGLEAEGRSSGDVG